MKKKSKGKRIEEGKLTEELRWEFIRRSPEFKSDKALLIKIQQQILAQESPQEMLPLLQEYQALREKMLEEYRLNFIPDSDPELAKGAFYDSGSCRAYDSRR